MEVTHGSPVAHPCPKQKPRQVLKNTRDSVKYYFFIFQHICKSQATVFMCHVSSRVSIPACCVHTGKYSRKKEMFHNFDVTVEVASKVEDKLPENKQKGT